MLLIRMYTSIKFYISGLLAAELCISKFTANKSKYPADTVLWETGNNVLKEKEEEPL